MAKLTSPTQAIIHIAQRNDYDLPSEAVVILAGIELLRPDSELRRAVQALIEDARGEHITR